MLWILAPNVDGRLFLLAQAEVHSEVALGDVIAAAADFGDQFYFDWWFNGYHDDRSGSGSYFKINYLDSNGKLEHITFDLKNIFLHFFESVVGILIFYIVYNIYIFQ